MFDFLHILFLCTRVVYIYTFVPLFIFNERKIFFYILNQINRETKLRFILMRTDLFGRMFSAITDPNNRAIWYQLMACLQISRSFERVMIRRHSK